MNAVLIARVALLAATWSPGVPAAAGEGWIDAALARTAEQEASAGLDPPGLRVLHDFVREPEGFERVPLRRVETEAGPRLLTAKPITNAQAAIAHNANFWGGRDDPMLSPGELDEFAEWLEDRLHLDQLELPAGTMAALREQMRDPDAPLLCWDTSLAGELAALLSSHSGRVVSLPNLSDFWAIQRELPPPPPDNWAGKTTGELLPAELEAAVRGGAAGIGFLVYPSEAERQFWRSFRSARVAPHLDPPRQVHMGVWPHHFMILGEWAFPTLSLSSWAFRRPTPEFFHFSFNDSSQVLGLLERPVVLFFSVEGRVHEDERPPREGEDGRDPGRSSPSSRRSP